MICKVKNTVEKYGMLPSNKSVIVGFSGGADSCALLHILWRLKDEYNIRLTAAHVNHGIRGAEAQRDEDFVIDFCKKLDIPLKVLHCDVPKEAQAAGLGLEEYGRKIRYEFFESIDKSALVATAHNLNDCCETLLFNITRGASVKGLCSIPAVRGNIIRPLIECSRAEIEAYCRENGIDFITDSTNGDDSYARNRIRLNVIPQLKLINPSFEQAAARLIESANEDDAYWQAETEKIVHSAEKNGGYDAKILSECHSALQKRAIAYIIKKETGSFAETVHIKNVCDILSGGRTQVLSGTKVSVERGVLSFGEKNLTEGWQREFSLDEEIITPKKTVRFMIVNSFELSAKQFVHKNVLDYEKISGKLLLRSRLSGDEIRIAGRNCTKSLKKLFTENKISDKNGVCVLADDLGVVWVEGFGCAERCKISEETKKALKIVY